ncbi:hypothetical protein [Rhizobium sp. BK376]|uniref:hypothetical protein n=1 Tax=Rhizobium sp. BK376 TaxID=2512149 RepID=UPI001404D727|nr:hypothetical protein [Rhizobium sp. BK376]
MISYLAAEALLANDITSGEDQFYERLCHASKGGFGIMVEMTQEACFRAIRAGRSELASRHFANEYESNSSNPDLNIFRSPDWREITSTYDNHK